MASTSDNRNTITFAENCNVTEIFQLLPLNNQKEPVRYNQNSRRTIYTLLYYVFWYNISNVISVDALYACYAAIDIIY